MRRKSLYSITCGPPCPNGLISGSGMDVGLPDGQMGNSEVGHMNLGAGRVVYQDFTRVTKSIRDGEFFENPTLCAAVDKAVAAGKAVHFMGLLSDGGVHSHQDHLIAMAELAFKRGAEKIYLHAFLDGRDTPPKSAASSIELLDATFKALGKGRIASIVGRYFAMDRDNRWDRVAQAYNLIVDGHGEFNAATAQEGLEAAYARGESDEFVKATTIGEPVKVEDGDAMVFMNFRADRARELTRVFVEDDFNGIRARPPTRTGRFRHADPVRREHPGTVRPSPPAAWKTCWATTWRKTARPNCASPKPKNTRT